MRMIRTTSITILTLALLATPATMLAQSDPLAIPVPEPFSGRLECGPDIGESTDAEMDGHASGRGGANRTTVRSMSDQRLAGSWTRTSNWDEWGEVLGIEVVTWRMEDDAGAWEGSDIVATLGDGVTIAGPAVLVGEGAYEGLNVVMQALSANGCGWDVNGMIIDGEVTPAPEPAVGS